MASEKLTHGNVNCCCILNNLTVTCQAAQQLTCIIFIEEGHVLLRYGP